MMEDLSISSDLKEKLFTLYFAILHDLMVFQVHIQDCFRSCGLDPS